MDNLVYFAWLDDTAFNPEHIAAVWVYTAGDVFLNVRADGMTFKKTFPVAKVPMEDRSEPSELEAAEQVAEYEKVKRQAHSAAEDIRGQMIKVLNRDS